MEKPRGIRNNNPGNIERTGNDKWQGLSKKQDADPRFCVFDNPVYGIRALARTLITYQDKHDCRTVGEFINRWAPPSENNTTSYAVRVAAHLGVSVGTEVDMHEYATLRGMCEAIIEHENGRPWKFWYTEAQMAKAMVLAGVEPKKKPLVKSKTILGSSLAATATVAGPVLQETANQIEPLAAYSDSIKTVFLALTLLGVIIAIWAKVNERMKGIS